MSSLDLVELEEFFDAPHSLGGIGRVCGCQSRPWRLITPVPAPIPVPIGFDIELSMLDLQN